MPRPETIAELAALSPHIAAALPEALRQLEAEDRARLARKAWGLRRAAPGQSFLDLSAQALERQENELT